MLYHVTPTDFSSLKYQYFGNLLSSNEQIMEVPVVLYILLATIINSALGQQPIIETQLYHNITDPFFKPFPEAGSKSDYFTWANVRNGLLDAQEEVCKASRLCNPKGPKPIGLDSCNRCEACFCDDVCHIYGDCCLDKIIDEHLMDKQVLETHHVLGPEISECMDLRAKRGKYMSPKHLYQQRLISRCPANFEDPMVISDCENSGPINARVLSLDITPEQLSQNWPVASSRSSLFYKNRACAKCHSDDDEDTMVFWQLKLSYDVMPQLPPSADPRTLLEAFLKDPTVEVSFSAPNGTVPRHCQYILEQESLEGSQCNKTGLRFMYDPVLWKSCEIFPTFFRVDQKLFPNLFCYWCQNDLQPWLANLCGREILFPFFVVLSPDAIESVKKIRQTFDCQCRPGFMYDPYKDDCRKLHCSTGRKLSEFECVSTVDSGDGLKYSISLTMTSQQPLSDATNFIYPPNPGVFQEVAEFLKSSLTSTLFEDSRLVSYENFIVHARQLLGQEQLKISVYAEMRIKSAESQEDLENRLLSLHNYTWTLHLPDQSEETSLTSVLIKSPKVENILSVPKDFVTIRFEEHFANNVFAMRNAFIFAFQNDDFSQRNTMVPAFNPETPIVRPYAEVKNTLICPHFIFELANTSDVMIKTRNNGSSQWPYTDEVLVHVSSDVELTTLDFAYADGGLVIVCVDKIREIMKTKYQEHRSGIDSVDVFGTGLVLTSHVCLGISVVCLTLTLLTYCLFPSLRTLPGKSTMGLVGALLLAIVLFLAGGFIRESSVECQVIGVLTHFFLLSAFVWMFVCTVHMYGVFSNVLKHTPSGESGDARRFALYSVISVIVPGIIVSSTIITNYALTSSSDSNDASGDSSSNTTSSNGEIDSVFYSCSSNATVRIGYGDGICYLSNKLSLLLSAALPITLLCTANLVMFILTMLAFRSLSKQEKVARKEEKGHLVIYIKLSTLTGEQLKWA
ncbi:adhesion G-protein coupled receptor g6 [Plakobranchus ocellatus]|uniref:Adhesion G-protein coupled receptor g6 n=1 Tax=Plakobranchus ocellatus TaxID=259542 RepID=A0AAV3YDR8_9GAST|nr:adhesion G-protein coupled receptor g6 [Plakobranchus ocellatus]